VLSSGVLRLPFGNGRHAPIAGKDQAYVIAAILENPEPHDRQIYPLYGPVEYTYRETAEVLSRVLGKSVEYKQVDFEELQTTLQAGGKASAKGRARDGNDFLFQHLREVAIDHQNGIFAGTNDLVEKLGGRPPMTLEAFITQYRRAFE